MRCCWRVSRHAGLFCSRPGRSGSRGQGALVVLIARDDPRLDTGISYQSCRPTGQATRNASSSILETDTSFRTVLFAAQQAELPPD